MTIFLKFKFNYLCIKICAFLLFNFSLHLKLKHDFNAGYLITLHSFFLSINIVKLINYDEYNLTNSSIITSIIETLSVNNNKT